MPPLSQPGNRPVWLRTFRQAGNGNPVTRTYSSSRTPATTCPRLAWLLDDLPIIMVVATCDPIRVRNCRSERPAKPSILYSRNLPGVHDMTWWNRQRAVRSRAEGQRTSCRIVTRRYAFILMRTCLLICEGGCVTVRRRPLPIPSRQ